MSTHLGCRASFKLLEASSRCITYIEDYVCSTLVLGVPQEWATIPTSATVQSVWSQNSDQNVALKLATNRGADRAETPGAPAVASTGVAAASYPLEKAGPLRNNLEYIVSGAPGVFEQHASLAAYRQKTA